MQKLILLMGIGLLLNWPVLLNAQSPDTPKAGFNYQAVLRNNTGQILPSQPISLKASIRAQSAEGEVVYSETHAITSSEQGMLHLVIGRGTPLSGTFQAIAWGSQSHFLQIEIDADGGQDYQMLGVSEILSVPSALYAKEAGTITGGLEQLAGSHWYDGSGAPVATIGKDGDYYLDLNTADIYKKENGTWTHRGKLRPTQGGDTRAGDDWLLTGNAGTSPGTQYIGTSDATDLVFKTNATEALRIDDAQNVGIGTTSPSGKLHVKDNGHSMVFTGQSSSFPRLGIGTSSPSSHLHFKSSSAGVTLRLENSGNLGRTWAVSSNRSGSAFARGGSLSFHDFTEGETRLVIDSTGQVGIGTLDPVALLHVSSSTAGEGAQIGNAFIGIRGSNTNFMELRHADNASADEYALIQRNTGETWLNAKDQTGLHLRTGNTDRLYIDGTRGNVAIGNATPDSTAQLEIISTTKGILIPRMTTAQRTAIAGAATGLMVYDNTTSSFWFYSGSAWVEITTENSDTDAQTLTFFNDSLSISGGDTAALNISKLTDDDNDTKVQVEESADEDIIRFDMGGTEFFRMDSGRLAVVNTGQSVFIGEDAGTNDDLSNNYNVFVGGGSGQANTTGDENVAIGRNALFFNSTGGQNVAVGVSSLSSNSGSYNVAMGRSALQNNTSGTANIGIGPFTNLFNNSGSQNTIIGYEAGRGTATHAKSGNVFLGYQAGYDETGSNLLYIENSNSSSPLIWGDFSNDTVRINGAFDVTGSFLVDIDELTDADNDTKIQVEESADEDIIRFDLGGTEFFTMDSGRLAVYNTGHSVFIGDQAGIADDLTNNDNTFIGYRSGRSNTTGSDNTGVGYWTLDANTTGTENTAVGELALGNNTIGISNTALGSTALTSNTQGASNVAVGRTAMQFNLIGSQNTAIGASALNNTISNYNVAVGSAALFSITSGNSNVGVGTNVDLYNNTGSQNTIIGYEAGRNTTPHAKSGNVFLGYQAGYSETGSNLLYIENSNSASPLIWGDFANDTVRINGAFDVTGSFLPVIDELADADNDTKIQVEESGDEDIIRFDMAGTEFFRMDSGRLDVLNTGGSVFIGADAGLNDDLSNNFNVFIGEYTGRNNTTGSENVAIGRTASQLNTTGSWNSVLGIGALTSNTTGNLNVALGYLALNSNTNDRNVAVGPLALQQNTTGAENIGIGSDALNLNTTGNYNVAIGRHAGGRQTAGDNNVLIGYEAGKGGFDHTKTGNIRIGYQAGMNDTSDNKLYIENSSSTTPLIYGDFANDTVRVNGYLDVTGGSSINQIIDADSDTKIQVEESADEDIIRFDMGGTEYFRMDSGRLEVLNTGNSVFIGEGAGAADDLTTNTNVFVGYIAGQSNTDGAANVAIGAHTFINNTIGIYNNAMGQGSLYNNTSGSSNAAIGKDAAFKNTTGSNNITIGEFSGYDNTIGGSNVIIGNRANENDTTGSQNTIIGHEAGRGAADHSKTGNVFLGYKAGYSETGSNLLYIENSNSASPLIYGDFAADSVQINGDFAVTGSGYKTGGGTWSTFSDRRLKKNITSFEDGLEQLMQVKPVRFQYNGKAGNPDGGKTYVGVIAQDVQQYAPYMIDTVSRKMDARDAQPTDLLMYDGSALTYILVNAVQEQQQVIASQERLLEELTANQKAQQKQLLDLAEQVKALLAEQEGNPSVDAGR